MLTKQVKWTEDDIKDYRSLRSVISQGDFDLKGSAIMKVAQLMLWYDKLEDKIQVAIGLQAKDAAPKMESMNIKPKASSKAKK